jgi:hypothetical protein
VSIRYETEDAVSLREVGGGDERGATALDPDSMERAQPRRRSGGLTTSASNGVPLDGGSLDHRSGSQPTRRHVAIPGESVVTRRSSSMPTDPVLARRNSPAPVESMGGITQPYQRPRGKRTRVNELDPAPTQTFGPADPLPPSPGAREQTEGWFRPSLFTESIPDLGAMAGDTNRTYDPHIHNLPGLSYQEEVENAVHPPAHRPLIDLQARPWVFSLLLAATCLAVGMVVGALLFGNRTGASAPSERDQVVIRCSDPPPR